MWVLLCGPCDSDEEAPLDCLYSKGVVYHTMAAAYSQLEQLDEASIYYPVDEGSVCFTVFEHSSLNA